MKKICSLVLAILMISLISVPAFAADGSFTVTFTAPSEALTQASNEIYANAKPDAENPDPGVPYYFVQSVDGKVVYVEGADGVSVPKRFEFDEGISVNEGEFLSFKVFTNEVYNAATASVYVNGQALSPDSRGEYRLYADRNLTVRVNEDTLMRSHFSVKLVSGEGYSVKPLKGESARFALYGDTYKFRVKIGSGYSDADLKVILIRGTNELAEILGDDLDSLSTIFNLGNAEVLFSDGIDSEGCRTYTIKNVTGDCKVLVTGVRSTQTQSILTFLKRVIKMILDIFGIDSSFLGLAEMVAYYDVTIDDNALNGIDADYILLSGIFDEFKPTIRVEAEVEDPDEEEPVEENAEEEDPITYGYFTVMSGESVTIRLTTKDKALTSTLGVQWKVEGRDEVTQYSTGWVASYDTATGYVYYSATFVVDSINAPTHITIVNG